MKETADIVNDLINRMSLTLTPTEVVDNLDGTYTVFTKNTRHLQNKFPLTIASVPYTVTAFTKNVSVTLSGASAPANAPFDVYPAHYFHGTVIMTLGDKRSVPNAANVFERTPMIYLKEIIEDDNYNDDSAIAKETPVRLFFLSQSSLGNWKTVDHYREVIGPMRNLVEEFIRVCNVSTDLIGRTDALNKYKTINHINFGVYYSNGHEKQVFSDQLSGIELVITLPFTKKACEC